MKYSVDPAHMRPGEGRLFSQYVSQQSLHIDVWDGDSLLLIGSCQAELKVASLLLMPNLQYCFVIFVTVFFYFCLGSANYDFLNIS